MSTAAVQGLQPPPHQHQTRPGLGRAVRLSLDKSAVFPPVSGRSSTSNSRPQTPSGPSGRPLVGRSSSSSSSAGHQTTSVVHQRLTPSPAPSSSSISNPYPTTRPSQPHHRRQYSFPLGMASSVSLHRGGAQPQTDHRNPYSFARFRDPFESPPSSGTGSAGAGSGNSGVGGVSSTASKLMTSVKRTLSFTAKKLDTRPTYPYATPYETAFDVPRRPPPAAPPTLAEIAQGLIPTRTPTPKRTPRPPTPPLVSSMKRTDRDSSFTKSSTASASSSSMPVTPTSSLASRTAPVRKKLGFALARFYSRDNSKSGNGTAPPVGASPADSSVSLPRKAVRFSTSERGGAHGPGSGGGSNGDNSLLDLPDSSEWSRSTSALGMAPPGLDEDMSRSTSALGRSASDHGHAGGIAGRVTMTISEYAFMRRTFGRPAAAMTDGGHEQARTTRGGDTGAAGLASSPSAFRLFNR